MTTERIPNADWDKLDSVLKFLWKRNFRAPRIAALFGIPTARVATRATTLGLPRRYGTGRNPKLLPKELKRGPRGPYKSKYNWRAFDVGEEAIIKTSTPISAIKAAAAYGKMHGATFACRQVAPDAVRVSRVL
jgi:hypothetical protein